MEWREIQKLCTVPLLVVMGTHQYVSPAAAAARLSKTIASFESVNVKKSLRSE